VTPSTPWLVPRPISNIKVLPDLFFWLCFRLFRICILEAIWRIVWGFFFPPFWVHPFRMPSKTLSCINSLMILIRIRSSSSPHLFTSSRGFTPNWEVIRAWLSPPALRFSAKTGFPGIDTNVISVPSESPDIFPTSKIAPCCLHFPPAGIKEITPPETCKEPLESKDHPPQAGLFWSFSQTCFSPMRFPFSEAGVPFLGLPASPVCFALAVRVMLLFLVKESVPQLSFNLRSLLFPCLPLGELLSCCFLTSMPPIQEGRPSSGRRQYSLILSLDNLSPPPSLSSLRLPLLPMVFSLLDPKGRTARCPIEPPLDSSATNLPRVCPSSAQYLDIPHAGHTLFLWWASLAISRRHASDRA